MRSGTRKGSRNEEGEQDQGRRAGKGMGNRNKEGEQKVEGEQSESGAVIRKESK